MTYWEYFDTIKHRFSKAFQSIYLNGYFHDSSIESIIFEKKARKEKASDRWCSIRGTDLTIKMIYYGDDDILSLTFKNIDDLDFHFIPYGDRISDFCDFVNKGMKFRVLESSRLECSMGLYENGSISFSFDKLVFKKSSNVKKA
ncbi:MAG: hypothetical protein ACLSAP_06520 [Oscillospiraceae bacterium]